MSVLVVDDDIGAANALGRLLRAMQHIVHVAHDSIDGLELAVKVRPDLILHDIVMPPIDGYEVARRLRAIPAMSKTLLIACSAAVDERVARRAGFDGWLLKPVSDGELDSVLAMALQRIGQRSAAGERRGVGRTRG